LVYKCWCTLLLHRTVMREANYTVYTVSLRYVGLQKQTSESR